jgi:hypothetical protein
LISAPVLAIPDFSKAFVIETDASDIGFGAVLMQGDHPVAYLSKPVCTKNQSLSTYEKECMAIIFAVDKWRPYLQHQQFTIRTDHQSLLHLTQQRVSSKLQHKALMKLMDLDFRIVYKQGATNRAADALSRCYSEDTVLAVSSCNPIWMQKVMEGYADDPEAQQLLAELAVHPDNARGYSLQEGLIRYKGRVWLGSNTLAQNHVIQALHSSAVGGHSGALATYQRIKALFAWPQMRTAITQFVQSCTVCQQAKSEHVKKPGLLQPLPIPDQAWQVVCMDFIEGLPKSARFDTILVVIDKFTKYGHFIPLAHPFTALQVAQAFLDHVYKLHGLPQSIISDRDRIFTSAVWRELFRLTDTKLLMSSSYHPQTDGQTERLNQCLENFLRCSVSACPKQWSKWLSVAEFWYNTTFHTALGTTPFQVLYGHSPKQLGIINPLHCHSSEIEQWMRERNLLNEVVQHNLSRAQLRMKQHADKNRSERQFSVGDMVYLKVQPYIQSTVAQRSNQKLSYRFYGPYKILARVGSVAYHLDLPSDARIHPVVHVSQLKPHIAPGVSVHEDIAAVPVDPDMVVSPLQFLGSRMVVRGSTAVSQVKASWSNMPAAFTSWEEINDLKQRFPEIPAWGQAGFRGRSNVTYRKKTREVG